MAKALNLVVGPKAKETSRFADMFDKFFDCMNCSTLSAGKRSRNPFKSPFRSGSDWKLKVFILLYCFLEKNVLYTIYFPVVNRCILTIPG